MQRTCNSNCKAQLILLYASRVLHVRTIREMLVRHACTSDDMYESHPMPHAVMHENVAVAAARQNCRSRLNRLRITTRTRTTAAAVLLFLFQTKRRFYVT